MNYQVWKKTFVGKKRINMWHTVTLATYNKYPTNERRIVSDED